MIAEFFFFPLHQARQYMSTQPFSRKRQIRRRTHLIQKRRGPKVVLYTDGLEQVIEQRASLLLPLLTHLRQYGHALDPVCWCPKLIANDVMWWANTLMIGAAVITPFHVRFVLALLMNLVFNNEHFWRILGVLTESLSYNIYWSIDLVERRKYIYTILKANITYME